MNWVKIRGLLWEAAVRVDGELLARVCINKVPTLRPIYVARVYLFSTLVSSRNYTKLSSAKRGGRRMLGGAIAKQTELLTNLKYVCDWWNL